MERLLAIIPARKGSKGLPGKNTGLVAGKPLVQWSIEAAIDQRLITTIHVSTDDDDVLKIARFCGVKTPFTRPESLATDTASVIDVVEWVINQYHEAGEEYDAVLLLEPTSPIRRPEVLGGAIDAFLRRPSGVHGLVTVGEMANHPALAVEILDNRMRPFRAENFETGRRQEYQTCYFPFGVAYIAEVSFLLEKRAFLAEGSMPYVIPKDHCFEIDDAFDREIVELVLRMIGEG